MPSSSTASLTFRKVRSLLCPPIQWCSERVSVHRTGRRNLRDIRATAVAGTYMPIFTPKEPPKSLLLMRIRDVGCRSAPAIISVVNCGIATPPMMSKMSVPAS